MEPGGGNRVESPRTGAHVVLGGRRNWGVAPSAEPNPVFDIEVVSMGTTEVTLTWKNLDQAASEYRYVVHSGKEIKVITKQHINVTITDLEPGTYYVFFISPELKDGTQGSPKAVTVTTKPNPVSELQVTDVGIAEATLSWHSDNSTVATHMLLEGFEDETNSSSQVLLNISGLEPGFHKQLINACRMMMEHRFSGFKSHALSLFVLDWIHALRKNGSFTFPAGHVANFFTFPFSTDSSQVVNIQVEEVSDTEVKLAWENSDNSSSSYTYRIHVAADGHSFDQNSNNTYVAIRGLNSSTLYNFTVYPKRNQDPEGQPAFAQTYTAPHPVSDFRVQDFTTTSISLAWNSEASSFRILVQELTNHSLPRNETHQEKQLLVTGLTPGTPYCFEIFPQAPDGREGLSRKLVQTTEPSIVSDIEVVSVNTTAIHLKWQNRDNASLGYRYHLLVETDGSWVFNSTIGFLNETIGDLVPGTRYNVTIYPEVGNGTKGSPASKVVYTRPSPVSTINISSISTTEVTLSWQETDSASTGYTYLIILVEGGSVSPVSTSINQTLTVRNATITDLSPGTFYEVRIYSQVGEDALQGEPGHTSFCTDAASVAFLECNPVPKQSTLTLRWPCPPGMNNGFSLTVHSGEWSQEISLPPCNSTDVTDDFNVTHLNYSTAYSISLTTLSCGKKSFPIQNVSQTSITDPPPPDGLPNIFPISHNSLKVKFGKFEASHGPITAYAVILTTDGSGNKSSADFLKYTYDDFKKGTSKTYVTYLMSMKEERAASALSDVLKYEVIVGNESTTDGYYNGKLEPLSSYRACIAGFTNITFDSLHLINGTESYVSFSLYSDAVSLPQNPAVICGAVFGCIFGALVIVAVGGFIFWRRKRKDAKNSDVSFSQIKSKIIKVENFESYFKKQQADSNCGFAEEYEDLKLIGVNQPKFAAEIPENRGKNRYNNVLPYDISRVKLSIQTQVTDDYINANYMPGYYSKRDFIATQGPLPNTLKDFWRMVWEKNIYSIVMLTKCVEQGRTKCEEYWPSKQTQNYGDITVGIISEIILPEWTIRDFTVKNTSESHPLRQFHFTSWPDHGVPDTTDLLINFRYLVNDYMKQSPPESPVLVHCSAGVGRTGTFIAIDRLIHQMENENAVDVYGIVYDLRLHRPLMVQTEDQYVFLNQCVWDIIKSQKDSKADLIYQNTTAMTIYENLEPMTAFGKTNGYIA
uniref:Receptor-type tyrosine-protein phosphatase eta n=1 Tax=Vombatus ursinus TaxID=29139 RepID=A0A4X2KJV4_VOMUR